MVFYLTTSKKEHGEKRSFSKFGRGIEDRSAVSVSMVNNDLIEAQERRHWSNKVDYEG